MSCQVNSALFFYFQTINDCQQRIQHYQEQLLLNPCFNAYQLYKHVAHPQLTLTQASYLSYITHKVIRFEQTKEHFQVVRKHLQKNGFQQQISFQTFLNSLIPYTPNVNRQCDKNITLQQCNQLTNQQRSKYNPYLNQVSFIKKSIQVGQIQKQSCAEIQQKLKDIITVQWMECYSEFEFYQILNVIRWCGGVDVKSLQNGLIFYKTQTKKSLNKSLNKSRKSSSANKRSKHRLSSQDKPQTNSRFTHASPLKNTVVSQNILSSQQIVKSFCYCLKTIIILQKNKQQFCMKLQNEKTKQILSKCLSLKIVPINTIIQLIKQQIVLQSNLVLSFYNLLKDLTITSRELQLTVPCNSGRLQNSGGCKRTLCEVLLTACTEKAVVVGQVEKIKDRSRELFKMLCAKGKALTSKDMALFLVQFNIPCNGSQLQMIMGMLGDGMRIYEETFCAWFQKQMDNMHLRVIF